MSFIVFFYIIFFWLPIGFQFIIAGWLKCSGVDFSFSEFFFNDTNCFVFILSYYHYSFCKVVMNVNIDFSHIRANVMRH